MFAQWFHSAARDGSVCALCSVCPQWFHSTADGGEGSGGVTGSKFRADWAFRQRDFEVFPGRSHGPGRVVGTETGAVLQSPMCCARVECTLCTAACGSGGRAAVNPAPGSCLNAGQLRARPGCGGDLCSATVHPGVSLEQAGQEPGAAPELIPGRRAHRSSSAVSRAGVCGRGSHGQSLVCGFLSSWG